MPGRLGHKHCELDGCPSMCFDVIWLVLAGIAQGEKRQQALCNVNHCGPLGVTVLGS